VRVRKHLAHAHLLGRFGIVWHNPKAFEVRAVALDSGFAFSNGARVFVAECVSSFHGYITSRKL
jgi:hypothetical protein